LVSIWDLENIFFEAALLFWTLLLIMMTAQRLGSAYMCMILVAFPLLLRQLVLDNMEIKMQGELTAQTYNTRIPQSVSNIFQLVCKSHRCRKP